MKVYFIFASHSNVNLKFTKITFNSMVPDKHLWFLTSSSTSNKYEEINHRWVSSGKCNSLSFLFHFSRKIKESLECFPVKLNNLIHTLAQMTAISPAKSTSQNFSQESCTLSASRSITRATILGFSKKTSNVSLKLVILI